MSVYGEYFNTLLIYKNDFYYLEYRWLNLFG